MNKPTNTLSISGMVVGLISLLLSFIPCIGIIGVVGAIVGLILSIMGYKRAKEDGSPTTIGLIGIIASTLGIIIGLVWTLFLAKVGNDIGNVEAIEYNSCDEALADYEATIKEMKTIDENKENEGLEVFGKILKMTQKIAGITKSIEEMDCRSDSTFNARWIDLKDSID